MFWYESLQLTLSAPQLQTSWKQAQVKSVGSNSSYLAGFSIFYFHGSMKKFNQLA